VHFRHAGPEVGAHNRREYEITFPRGTVIFNSTFTGFVLPRAHLDRELPTQDPQLHSVLRSHAERMLAELPKVETFTERVRARLLEDLRTGEPSAAGVAKALGVGLRTMARRLEDEGTTYKTLLDELRRGLALSYTKSSDLLLADIALLLGFSHAAAFNRAFKRWTGMAPLEYRRAHRRV
jgi:AraC-like DNA-binding protein